MDFFSADIGWLVFAYFTGTCVGWYFAFTHNAENIVANAIDSLIDNGFLRTRRNDNGEIEILKYDDKG